MFFCYAKKTHVTYTTHLLLSHLSPQPQVFNISTVQLNWFERKAPLSAFIFRKSFNSYLSSARFSHKNKKIKNLSPCKRTKSLLIRSFLIVISSQYICSSTNYSGFFFGIPVLSRNAWATRASGYCSSTRGNTLELIKRSSINRSTYFTSAFLL
jgi:hypothetical protein